MSSHNKTNNAVFTTLSLVAMAVSGIVNSVPGYADSHIVRVDANTGITYNSAMSNYRALDDSEKNGWKQSNDTVGKIGGWRTYANEAYKAKKRMDEAQIDDVVTAETAEPVSDLEMSNLDEKKMATNTPMTRDSQTPRPILGLSHQSATDQHRGYKEITLQDWKAANDRVGEIGGWRAYAKEAYEANKEMVEEAGAN